jgi:cytochrome P450
VDEEWLQTTIGYTEQLIICATVLKHIPSFLLPLVYHFVPPYRKLRRTNDTALRLIKPIIQSRRELMDKPGFVGSDDIMQWMLNERVKKSFGDKDYSMMAQFQLQLSFAAVHTTSMALVNILFDLLAYPENLAILREKINESPVRNGGSFQSNFYKSLEKVDSFMKESQRHNPVGYSKSTLS